MPRGAGATGRIQHEAGKGSAPERQSVDRQSSCRGRSAIKTGRCDGARQTQRQSGARPRISVWA
eukprot:15454789-Alexandrium_andersonii.AAC.1